MENENTDRTLQIALGSYDRKELRVQKNYIQEQCAGSECTCFQNGSRLLEQLQQGRRFDAVILCSQLEDMSGLELLTELRTTEARPPVLMIDEARRQNSSILCPESGEGPCYVGRTELRSLLWELYRMPGRQNRQMERRCQELYEGWGIRQPDMNSRYLSSAVGVVYGTIQKLAIRKESCRRWANSMRCRSLPWTAGSGAWSISWKPDPPQNGWRSKKKAALQTKSPRPAN